MGWSAPNYSARQGIAFRLRWAERGLMNEKLVVVLDLVRLRAYRLKQGREFSEPGLELIEDWQTEVRRHLSEEVTDEAGRFRKGTAHTEGPSALSDGEQHNPIWSAAGAHSRP